MVVTKQMKDGGKTAGKNLSDPQIVQPVGMDLKSRGREKILKKQGLKKFPNLNIYCCHCLMFCLLVCLKYLQKHLVLSWVNLILAGRLKAKTQRQRWKIHMTSEYFTQKKRKEKNRNNNV